MNIQKTSLALLLCLLHSGCSLFGIGSEEQPQYRVIKSDENKEIRQYAAHLVAKTTIQGSFKEAQSEGFRVLAGFIFGKNQSQQKIAMTAPVLQEETSENISMTAPVLMQEQADQSWTMVFSMPSKYTQETLPQPLDSRVVIEIAEEKTFAVLRFTGFWSEERIQEKGEELMAWLSEHPDYKAISSPVFAGYNPPWTLPFFRRNEVLLEIENSSLSP